MPRRRKAGPKGKPGRKPLPEEDRLSVVVSYKATTAEAIGLRWVAEAREIPVAELVREWVNDRLVDEVHILKLRGVLTKKKEKSDDE